MAIEQINQVIGDVIIAQAGHYPKIIAHVVNDQGGFGAGVALGLAQTYPTVKRSYREWYCGNAAVPFKLGEVQYVDVTSNLFIANMLCQKGYISDENPHPFNFLAFHQAFNNVLNLAYANGLSVHMPRVGSGLGGANWEEVYSDIADLYQTRDLLPELYIYRL